MSALIDKLKNAAKSRANAALPDRLEEGSLLSQALQRAASERSAARGSQEQEPSREPDPPPAITQLQPPRPGHGLVALLVALAILAAVIAIWHASPSPYDTHQPPGLKLDQSLKTK